MATESKLIRCEPGAYTLIGESITHISCKLRRFEAANRDTPNLLQSSAGNTRVRLFIGAEEPDQFNQDYWTFGTDDKLIAVPTTVVHDGYLLGSVQPKAVDTVRLTFYTPALILATVRVFNYAVFALRTPV